MGQGGRRILRVLPALALGAALAGTGLPPVSAGGGPPATEDHLRAFEIFPPGEEGNVSATELAAGDFGPHYDDTLDTYAALVDDDDVTEAELGDYYHSMQFGITNGETIEATETPIAGLTIYRDGLGIPHIYADSFQLASYGLGYATAEDRLWEMDILRHAARGTLAQFVGPTFLDMDIQTRREGYTDAEVQAMLDHLDDPEDEGGFGADGRVVQDGLAAYADGVNAYIDELNSARIDERPAEYEATGNPFPVFPQAWSPLDTLFVAILQLRVFGETAGFELQNAAIYSFLRHRLGGRRGTRVFDDLLARNDPRSPTTIPADEGSFDSQHLSDIDPRSVAIPDDAEAMAAAAAREAETRSDLLAAMGLTAPASNALLVSADRSATGHPLEIGAPQVGYANPSFFWDVDVHAPGVDFRGPAVPGASALIPLGRGPDYAWSLTTGVSDAVDVRAERLCDPGGGEPTMDSNGYRYRGECREMESRQETFLVKPSPADPSGPPSVETRTFSRTRHGPVFDRGTVGGHPVAFVKERFFWMQEVDSLPQFLKWNTETDSVDDFAEAAASFTMSFNAFYADAQDIGYFHVGFLPRRAPGVPGNLPTWGTGRWEWRGRFPFGRHPQIVDPAQGWLANWNNKPATGWDSFDDFKWGPTQRVRLLQERMGALFRGGGRATLSDIVDVIRDAATRDGRGASIGSRMTRWAVGGSGEGSAYGQALDLVRTWIQEGAHRRNGDHDGLMDDGAALAIFDRWYDLLVHRVFDDELGAPDPDDPDLWDLLGGRAPVSDYSPTGGSSFFFDFSNYLDNAFRGQYGHAYCDDMGTARTESCRDEVRNALRMAVADLQEAQGGAPSGWTTPAENIEFGNLGAGSVADIPWQNRGTHNHVVEILSDAS